MNKVLVFIYIFLIFSCENQEKINENVTSMNDPRVPIYILVDSIENHGSTNAFDLLEIASLDFRAGQFLSTFLIMADKYENAFACMSVYYQVVWMYNIPEIENSKNGIYVLDSLNKDAKKMAIRYLIKADSLGNQEAKEHLNEYRKLDRRGL